jgi:hypothetical protein
MRQTAYIHGILQKSMIGDTTGAETPILTSWKWPEIEDAAEMLEEVECYRLPSSHFILKLTTDSVKSFQTSSLNLPVINAC